jgi:hypothetical protein
VRLEQAKEEFAGRYYRWALTEARRDVSERFPLLRSIKGSLAIRTLNYIETLAPIEQLELITASIKRFHPRGSELAGDRLSPRESQLIQAKNEAVLASPEPAQDDRSPISRSRLVTEIKKRMRATWGEPSSDRNMSFFRLQVGDWTVTTIVSCGKPPFYVQNIRAAERWSLQENISAFTWLGLGQYPWDLARAGDEADTARLIEAASTHFGTVASELLADLGLEGEMA